MAFTLLTLPFHFIPSSNSVVKNTAPPGDSLAREGQRLPQPDQDETLGCRYTELICRNAHDCNFCTFVWNLQLLAHRSLMGIWVSLSVLILWRSSRNWIIASLPTPQPAQTFQSVQLRVTSWWWSAQGCTHIAILSLQTQENTEHGCIHPTWLKPHITVSSCRITNFTFIYHWRVKIKNTNLVKHVKSQYW